jgi:hypothetical protein
MHGSRAWAAAYSIHLSFNLDSPLLGIAYKHVYDACSLPAHILITYAYRTKQVPDTRTRDLPHPNVANVDIPCPPPSSVLQVRKLNRLDIKPVGRKPDRHRLPGPAKPRPDHIGSRLANLHRPTNCAHPRVTHSPKAAESLRGGREEQSHCHSTPSSHARGHWPTAAITVEKRAARIHPTNHTDATS